MTNIEPRDFVLTFCVAGVLALTAWHCKVVTEKNDLRERVAGLEEGLKAWTSLVEYRPQPIPSVHGGYWVSTSNDIPSEAFGTSWIAPERFKVSPLRTIQTNFIPGNPLFTTNFIFITNRQAGPLRTNPAASHDYLREQPRSFTNLVPGHYLWQDGKLTLISSNTPAY
jgi:hypothetical protein